MLRKKLLEGCSNSANGGNNMVSLGRDDGDGDTSSALSKSSGILAFTNLNPMKTVKN